MVAALRAARNRGIIERVDVRLDVLAGIPVLHQTTVFPGKKIPLVRNRIRQASRVKSRIDFNGGYRAVEMLSPAF